MSQVNPNSSEPKEKKSIPLAITLVLLVISIMLNVMFSTKNIAANQSLSVQKGEVVLDHFKSLKSNDEQVIQYLDQILQNAADQHVQSRLIALHTIPYLDTITEELVALINDAAAYEKSKYSTDIPENFMMLETWRGQLQQIGDATGEMTQAEFDIVNEMLEQSQVLFSAITQFNFQVEDIKNALIRIGNGFEWIEHVESVETFLNVEQ